MDPNAKELIERGNRRFAKRAQLDSFRQEIALSFAPWHASFTAELTWGEDFCAHLTESTPVLLARDFANQIGAMLRPPGEQWFWHRSGHDDLNNDREVREYLDWRSSQMMRIMTDRKTGFQRAVKQADEFFGFFGDAVLSVDVNATHDQLRVRSYHIKDCVWSVGDDGIADVMTRRERISLRNMRQRFGEKAMCEKARTALGKDPDLEVEIRHEVLPAEEYDYNRKGIKRQPGQWASVWVDVTHQHVLRETTQPSFRYVVASWLRLPGMPYGISPATTIALPDARLIQAQAIAILEAAEKQINPPMIATTDVIRGDIRLNSAGVTWVDRSYDEREGNPLRPLELGKNFNLGVDALERTTQQLAKAMFLDVLRMPDTRQTKSTLEVKFLIDEYVRATLPLFAPLEAEYSAALHHEVDRMIELAGGYQAREMPERLRRQELVFAWDNPLGDMIERQKAQTVAEIAQLAQTIAALEAAAAQAPVMAQIDTAKMFREAATGIGAAGWLLDEDAAAQSMAQTGQQATLTQALGAAPNVAKLIDSGVNAAQVAATIPNPSEPGWSLPMPA